MDGNCIKLGAGQGGGHTPPAHLELVKQALEGIAVAHVRGVVQFHQLAPVAASLKEDGEVTGVREGGGTIAAKCKTRVATKDWMGRQGQNVATRTSS